jgi:hypothetical protein
MVFRDARLDPSPWTMTADAVQPFFCLLSRCRRRFLAFVLAKEPLAPLPQAPY